MPDIPADLTPTRQRPADRQAIHGREGEQKVIRDLLACVQRGAGGVVLVEGEPGIGTSLLLRDATDEAAGLGFSLATGAADQLGEAIPFSPLRAIVRDPAASPPPEHPDAASWWTAEVRAHLKERTAVAPVLVCLDDLHWAGKATLAVLRVLSLEMKTAQVAWLLGRSARPQHAAGCMFRLLESAGAARVALTPVDDGAVTAMLVDAFAAAPDEALSSLAREAAGNPALLAALIKGLRDGQAVRVTSGRAVLTSARLRQPVLSLAQRRLETLSDKARHLLVTAAVLGPTFRLQDAAEMLGQTPATLLPTVQEAMDASIIAPTEHTFTFRHELLRRCVEEMTPRPARDALHRQFGEILLTRGEPAARAASHHLLQAAHPGDPASLAGLDQAAAQVLGQAPQTAAGLATRALELTPPGAPAALARAVAAAEALTAAGRLDQAARLTADTLAKPLPPAAEARLRCALSAILSARGQASEAATQAQLAAAQPELPAGLRDQALTAHLQALSGSRDIMAGPVASTVLADDSHSRPVTVAALIARAVIAWDAGHASDALQFWRDAARDHGAASPDARRPQPLLALAAALVDLRQFGEADAILRAASHPSLRDIPAGAALFLLRARIHLATDRLADADADGNAALDIAQAVGARGYATAAHSVMALIELRRGNIAAAVRHIFAARPGDRPQFADLYARPETTAAEARVTEAGEGPAAVLGHLRELSAVLPTRPGLLLGDPALAGWLARAALAGGDGKVAASIARTAQALADANPALPVLAAAAAHSRGLIDRDPATLAQAASLHPDSWAKASAEEDLGVLHRSQGNRSQAIHHLNKALDGYRQAGADRDQARIRRRLRNLGIRRRHWETHEAKPVAGWESLTYTEQAVAGLVAEGLSNGQVGARMYISTHTVAHHLRQAFRKLEIASRYELTRIVIEQAADDAGPAR